MQFTMFFAWTACLLAVVSAENFTILVGDKQSLTFIPESVTARAGDTIAFVFLSKNHSVTQSTFAKPCEPITSPAPGVDSGFQSVPDGATAFPQWSFTLEDDKTPFWFFCSQNPHCSKGMVFAVNPTPEKTFASFKATAMGGTTSVSSASATGTSGASGPQTTDNSAQTVTGNHIALSTILASIIGLVL